ncbi:MAG: chromate resistance protein [Ignavibacteriae bacterium]|nr:chromate resistance protein [Ignavibacteriota bacterium]MCB9211097.1 chromate resistance protein [Ignavibacteriales bacterium]
MKWLFLVHQVQTRNSKERVKVWRLTKRIGAVLYRNSVYVLPYSEERNEDFHWLCQQIKDSKGDASVFVTETNNKNEDDELIKLFTAERSKDYEQITEKLNDLVKAFSEKNFRKNLEENVKKISKQLNQITGEFNDLQKIDFFNSPLSNDVKKNIREIKQKLLSLVGNTSSEDVKLSYAIQNYQNKIWATRAHIHIDRIASAWLIKRFVDAEAKFVFIDNNLFPEDVIQFDTFGAEFGHHGDNCTFETLIKVFRIRDKALQQIAEIVHDIDLKDNKFNRTEADGIDKAIRAISNYLNEDEKTLNYCTTMFDSFYNIFNNKKRRK